MADMVHYSAIFELPDGEHHAHGWTADLTEARKAIGRVLGRRRVLIPDETTKIVSVKLLNTATWEAEAKSEDQRIRDKYPDRPHVDNIFDTPNRILENRVTEEPDFGG